MSFKPDVWTVLSMLEWGTDFFSSRRINQPRLSIEWLLSHVLVCKRLDLYLSFDRPLSKTELEILRGLVQRRARHEPLQYITGHTDFYNCRIDVNPSVLIPRPETEQLVELVLQWGGKRPECRVLDIGTGSGCIAIAIKKEQPGWDVTGIDISPEALKTAAGNAVANQADVRFAHGDLFDPSLSGLHLAPSKPAFDLIVSNPPYITPGERNSLDIEVRDYEPSMALFHDNIGLVYASVRDLAATWLAPGGVLFLELSEFHAEKLTELFHNSRWETSLINDYSSKPRFIKAIPVTGNR